MNEMTPLYHLLEKIEEKMDLQSDDDVASGLKAVKWCIEHRMTQQGYTILREIIVSWVGEKVFEKRKDVYDKHKREIISKSLNIINKNIPEEKWENLNNRPSRDRVYDIKSIDNIFDIADAFVNLAKLRNDFNHAGYWKKPMDESVLTSKLPGHYEKVMKLLDGREPE